MQPHLKWLVIEVFIHFKEMDFYVFPAAIYRGVHPNIHHPEIRIFLVNRGYHVYSLPGNEFVLRIGFEVGRWKTEFPTQALAPDHLPANRIGIAQVTVGRFQVALVQCFSNLGGTHGNIVYFLCTDFLDLKAVEVPKSAQILNVGRPVASEAMVITNNNAFGIQLVNQDLPDILFCCKAGKIFGKWMDDQRI